MENIKSRFNNLRYEHFIIEFKGLIIEFKLIDNKAFFPNLDKKEKKDFIEQFKITIINKNKDINYYFYNSNN